LVSSNQEPSSKKSEKGKKQKGKKDEEEVSTQKQPKVNSFGFKPQLRNNSDGILDHCK
jgi:hypothetical protein